MIIILLGPPGSGKGTQANFIQNKLSIPHLSTGDILRQSVKNETDLGNKVKNIMAKGELVSDDLVLDLIKERVSQSDCNLGFILDGYPRNITQAESLNIVLKDMGLISNNLQPKHCKKAERKTVGLLISKPVAIN